MTIFEQPSLLHDALPGLVPQGVGGVNPLFSTKSTDAPHRAIQHEPISSRMNSGWLAEAASKAAGPLWAVSTSCPLRRNSMAMLSAASTLSSTASTRRGRSVAAGAGLLLGFLGASGRIGRRTTNSLP